MAEIVTELWKIENKVLEGTMCFAVPVEIFSDVSGYETVTAYSFCMNEVKELCKRFDGRLLSDEALSYLEKEFSAVAKNIGYERVKNENELMLEYCFTPDMQLTKTDKAVNVVKISSNAVLSKICEASGCDIEIADDGEDVIFAVVENGQLCAYAGMNDIEYGDGSVEISVETAPDKRRMGYGSSCVMALVEHLISQKKTVRYKCASDNSCSSALAEKCGFRLCGTRFSFVCQKI